LCNFSIIDITPPDYYLQMLRSPYINTLLDCADACTLASCSAFLTTQIGGYCELFFVPPSGLVYVPTDIDIIEVPKLYDARCFPDRHPNQPGRATAIPPPICGDTASAFNESYAQFVAQGTAANSESACRSSCLGFNCGSIAVDPTPLTGGCVFFNASSAAVRTGNDEVLAFSLYDQECLYRN
jgi:hypothetical protein